MPDLTAYPGHRLPHCQADQVQGDFAAILYELELVKGQLARLPTREPVWQPSSMQWIEEQNKRK